MGVSEVCRRLAQGAKSIFNGRKGTPPLAERVVGLISTIYPQLNDKKIVNYIKIIKKYKLEKRFEFIKKIKNKDLKKYYGESSVFVLPSYVDSFPYSLLEAMINKCAIISTNIGGIPEIINNEITGYTFKSGDIVSLCEKIEMTQLLSDDQYKTMCFEAQKFAKKN